MRSAYPDSAILWCYGQMDTRLTEALKKAVEQAGGSQQRLCFQPLSKAGKGELGTVGHPNIKGHRKAADTLKPVIAKSPDGKRNRHSKHKSSVNLEKKEVFNMQNVAVQSGTLTAPLRRDDFMWGVNAHNKWHPSYPEEQLDEQMRLAAEMGANIFRFNLNPEGEDPYFEKVVDTCRRYGMQFMLVMDDSGPAPDSEGYCAEQEDAYIACLVRRAVDVATRYAGRIAYLQIFNEVDIPCLVHGTDGDGRALSQFSQEWLQIYARRIQQVNAAVKAVNKDIKTVVNISYKHSGLFDYLAAYEGGVNFDVMGLDWYSDMGDLHEMLTYLERYPQKEILVCEINLWGSQQDTEEARTAYLQEVMDTAFRHPSARVKGLIFYELIDETALQPAGSDYNQEAHFGLVSYTDDNRIGQVKPAYTAIQQAITATAV